MKAASALLTLLVLLALAGCQAPPPEASHFPLAGGHQWVYDQITELEGNRIEHEELVLRNLGPAALDSGPAWRRRSDSGVEYWLRADASGVYRVASKSDIEDQPQPDPTPRYVLKAPYAVGTTWQSDTTTYLLRRRAEFPPELRHSYPKIRMTYTIEAAEPEVATRAGTFRDCLRVKGTAQLRLFADPVLGFRDMPLATTEWFCKGVGLVRLERSEPANSNFLSGGLLRLELVSWQ
jgi:hypothetical protein